MAEKPAEVACIERIAVVDQEALPSQEAAVVIDQVARRLLHPQPGRDWCDPRDLHSPRRYVDHEEHQVSDEPHSGPYLDREEVGGRNRLPMSLQELRPRHVGQPFRRRPDPTLPQDPPHRRSRDPVAQLRQLSDNPRIAPPSFSLATRTTSARIAFGTGGPPEPSLHVRRRSMRHLVERFRDGRLVWKVGVWRAKAIVGRAGLGARRSRP